VVGTSGDLRVTLNGQSHLTVSLGTANLEQFSLNMVPPPLVKSRECDVFFQHSSHVLARFRIKFASDNDQRTFLSLISRCVNVISVETSSLVNQASVASTFTGNERKRTNNDQLLNSHSAKTFCEGTAEVNESSQESSTVSSQGGLLHPAIRRCIINDRSLTKPARANVESSPNVSGNEDNHQKASTSFVSTSTQTKKCPSINDLTNDASLLLKEICARERDPRFFALERKCRAILQQILLERELKP
uniref:Uncharacterized protein n=1 Tax=Parascaris univalens TaxID=6257 RepID=A0A915CB72_PARUN